jgi:hypothetical protein
MNRLEAHKKDLYELRYSPMCKPAGEVANLTQLESHTTRARTLMLWRIAAGHLSWGPREVEILYQSTLDSISEAFDIFHYPISRYMLDARADVWEAGLAPQHIKNLVQAEQDTLQQAPPKLPEGSSLLLASELAQLTGDHYLLALRSALQATGMDVQIWMEKSGALAFALGAREVASQQAGNIIEGIKTSQATTLITDGPETAWAVNKILPELGLTLPEGVRVRSFNELLVEKPPRSQRQADSVFVHDSRSAYFLANQLPGHLAVLPEVIEDEVNFGEGSVYEAPRQLLDSMGVQRVFGAWTRGLAKSCGADDGLWLTYPDLAAGLARQRLEYARNLGATSIVTSSPLCANFLAQHQGEADPAVYWLPEYILEKEVIS